MMKKILAWLLISPAILAVLWAVGYLLWKLVNGDGMFLVFLGGMCIVGIGIQIACYWGISMLNECKTEQKVERIGCLFEFNQFVKAYPKRKVQAYCVYCHADVNAYDAYVDKKGFFRCPYCKDNVVDLTREEEMRKIY